MIRISKKQAQAMVAATTPQDWVFEAGYDAGCAKAELFNKYGADIDFDEVYDSGFDDGFWETLESE